VLLPLAACDMGTLRPAYGEENSVIVLAADSVWAAVGDSIQAALEPRVFTVRDEKTFEVTHASPFVEDWVNLRLFRQILAIGVPGDGWIEPLLDAHGESVDPPAVVEVGDVWARNQSVTAVIVPPGSDGNAVLPQLAEVAGMLDQRYRVYARQRMFASGPDSALADSLRSERGYTVLLPNVYQRERLPEADVFRNHAEMGGVLLRTLYIGSRPEDVAEPTQALALEWRDSAATAYDPGQRVEGAGLQSRTIEVNGRAAFETQGIWTSADATWPAAGPFISRIVPCPEQNRTYFLDAWLYAPGKSKYQYMIQLQTLLDSFRCGPGEAQAAAGSAD
jgi:hypothetical protein